MLQMRIATVLTLIGADDEGAAYQAGQIVGYAFVGGLIAWGIIALVRRSDRNKLAPPPASYPKSPHDPASPPPDATPLPPPPPNTPTDPFA